MEKASNLLRHRGQEPDNRMDVISITQNYLTSLFNSQETADEFLNVLNDILYTIDGTDKRHLVLEAKERIKSTSLLILLWIEQDDEQSWAELARLAGVNRSTIIREWRPKAVREFVSKFFDLLVDYLQAAESQNEYEKLKRFSEKFRNGCGRGTDKNASRNIY